MICYVFNPPGGQGQSKVTQQCLCLCVQSMESQPSCLPSGQVLYAVTEVRSGGKMDDTDRDPVHTALRETWEELGITMETVDIWGSMMALPTRVTGGKVTPVIGYCGEVDVDGLTISEDEVELVFTRTIKSICEPKHNGQTQFRTSPGYTLPVFLGGEHRIWGLTAMILHMALTIIAPGLYRHKLRHRS
ncbi:mitochondrial coenzyme A diphosphatase NUDT8-like isoform X2 [Haliotis rubra]|uniref:mitochondrial coenzyme A diphosphatase NUDT8-like isoform X2 n=1 Tax=Haliotis rubra TaxID=36100 RepID=UPI001EE4FF5D|nr:mitochondrial coenzyme A diphosphatase NUDT8-like isoform X2 [Haliotis rubra]